MLAELQVYILHRFEKSASVSIILNSFLEVYGSTETQDAFDTIINGGVHFIIWPCHTEWSSSPKLMGYIQYRCDILDKTYKGNAGWFKGRFFHKLIEGEEGATLGRYELRG